MVHEPAAPEELERLEAFIDEWCREELGDLPELMDVTRDEEIPRRWYIRLRGESREATAIWLTLGQRMLKYETYVLPAPEDQREIVYGWLLRQNYGLVGAQFSIGPEGAVFLTGELPVHAIDGDELDRIVGSLYEYVERFFRPALEMAFASMLAKART